MYHEFFYGPFADEAAIVAALKTLDQADPYWDYDCFAIHYGNPNARDYGKDLRYVSTDQRQKIETARKATSAPRDSPSGPSLH